MGENCGTGCQDPKHMIECLMCGAKYHYGIIHSCPTSCTTYQLLQMKSMIIRADKEPDQRTKDFISEDFIEKEEDDIRLSKRKSIRKCGKYKERGKEKKREP